MSLPFFSAHPSASPEEMWTAAFERVSQRIRRSFIRPETHQHALAYMQGLMSDVSRKNGWQVAEAVGEATPYAMQHLLDRAKWDCDGVRDALRGYVMETLAAPNAVLVVDETGFLKKGTQSVGVQRQYSGTAGRIENCQIGVFLTYASTKGHTLLDRELYLPKSWTQDSDRCRAADVPDEVSFVTKPELAARMLWRSLDAGLSVAWVTGDTVYGSAQSLRAGLEARKQAYALAVACKEHVEVQGTRRRVDQVARGLANDDWQELSAGAGSKGPRLFAWARIELAAPEVSGWQRWLLARQSLDEYEVRSWHGWFRHVTLSMLALAFLAALQTNGEENALKKSLSRYSRHQKQPILFKLRCLLIFRLWFPSVLQKSGGFSFAS